MTTSRYWWLRLLTVVVLAGCDSACQMDSQSSQTSGTLTGAWPACVRVFSEADYHFDQMFSHTWPRSDEHRDMYDAQDIRLGTAFAVMHLGHPVLITAAHVVARTPDESQAFLAQVYQVTITLKETSLRTRVSALGFIPDAVHVDPGQDMAVLEMPAEFWKTVPLRILTLSARATVAPTAHVIVWGFPSTSIPEFQELAVSDTSKEMLVLNGPLEPGYSGGPVVTKDGILLGMTLRSTDRQTRCVSPAELLRIDSHEATQ